MLKSSLGCLLRPKITVGLARRFVRGDNFQRLFHDGLQSTEGLLMGFHRMWITLLETTSMKFVILHPVQGLRLRH